MIDFQSLLFPFEDDDSTFPPYTTTTMTSNPNGAARLIKYESDISHRTVRSPMSINSSGLNDSGTNDIGNLVGDSFSDFNSDDSQSWMQKIDVSNFKQLTAANGEPKSGSVGSMTCGSDTSSATPPSDGTSPPTCPVMLDHGDYTQIPATDDTIGTKRRLGMQHVVPKASFPSPADSVATQPSPCHNVRAVPSSDVEHDYNQPQPQQQAAMPASNGGGRSATILVTTGGHDGRPLTHQAFAARMYPKPIYSYSCLIALALKNSKSGRLTVAEIYNFMCENFPYFRTAPAGWKNSVRHNLSLNKCFEKIEIEAPGGHGRKSCLWTLNPNKINKMDSEIRKWRDKDPQGVRESLTNPDELEMIERGEKGMPLEPNPAAFAYHEEHRNLGSQQLLVVRTASNSGAYPNYGNAHPMRTTQMNLSARSASWNTTGQHQHQHQQSAAKMPRLLRMHPPTCRTPPPQHQTPMDPFQLKQSPATYATPTRPQHQQQMEQSSPFSQTPPYSPNMQASMVPHATDAWSQQQHTPVKYNSCGAEMQHQNYDPSNIYSGYSPYALHKLTAMPPHGTSPSHGLFTVYRPSADRVPYVGESPCKLLNTSFGATGGATGATPTHQQFMGSYEATQSALNNNSLLQTALQTSPCKPMVTHELTLQSL